MRSVVFMLGLALVCSSVWATDGDMGSGTDPLTDGSEDYPYLIEDLADFDTFADPNFAATYWVSGVHTKLMTNIDLSGRTCTTAVIAPDTDTDSGWDGTEYNGNFDGNGYVVSNLFINGGYNYIGLFGRIGNNGLIAVLGLENVNIHGGYCVGGLCGYNNYGSIVNCHVTGIVEGTNLYVGGLCGYNNGSIMSSYTHGTVSGTSVVGGLCGSNNSDTVMNCYTTSTTSGENHVGGLCGSNSNGVANCYATGMVSGESLIGGLCGYNSGSVTNCYATGIVSSVGSYPSYVGGLCGINVDGSITRSYSIGSVSGYDRVGGLCGMSYGSITNCFFYHFSGPDNGYGAKLDDWQLQERASYVGFDFTGNSGDGTDDDWSIVEEYLPKLFWQTDNGPTVPFLLDSITTTLSGTGYTNDPFLITSLDDMIEFRNNLALRIGHYLLISNIDLVGETYATAFIPEAFNGYFDGNGYIVSHLAIDGVDYLGFFYKLYGEVVNFNMEDVDVNGQSNHVGGLCGKNYYGSIKNCHVTGVVGGQEGVGGLCGKNVSGSIMGCYANCYVEGRVSYPHAIGGLCGYNDSGSITDCYANGTVRGNYYYIGGLCGRNEYGTIKKSYATGDIYGHRNVGGLCGFNNSFSGITDCYADGTVNGYQSVGGLVGRNNNNSTVTLCHSTGYVRGSISAGGLCGTNSTSIITNSFWDTETSGIGDPEAGVSDTDGMIGKITAEMQTQSTFTGWDFATPIWMLLRENEDYPRLAWQEIFEGDIAGLYGVSMIDFAYLGQYWGLDDCTGVDDCGHADIDGSGDVGIDDLAEVTNDWLQGS